jgi:hypothetical protein
VAPPDHSVHPCSSCPALTAAARAAYKRKAGSLFENRPLALVAGRDLNPRPLGYEPYDARLWRLGPSPVTPLASASLRREAVSDLLCLLRLSLSRRVPCTIPCTNLVSDLLAVIPGTAGRAATAAGSAVPRRMPPARCPSQTV